MGRGTYWPFSVAWAKASRRGKDYCRILYRRGLIGKQLQLVITDGCPGLAAALQVVYPRVCISAVGFMRCATSWRQPASETTTR